MPRYHGTQRLSFTRDQVGDTIQKHQQNGDNMQQKYVGFLAQTFEMHPVLEPARKLRSPGACSLEKKEKINGHVLEARIGLKLGVFMEFCYG